MAGYVHLAAGEMTCRARKSPVVAVSVKETRVRYDHGRSRDALKSMGNDTVSPYGPEAVTHVSGLMNGEILTEQSIKFMQETWPHRNRGCVHLDSVNVKITVKPVIYIAREYKQGTCRYRSIVEHEMRHLAVDQQVAALYKTRIEQAIKAELVAAPVALGGPVPLSTISREQEKIQLRFEGLLKKYNAEMSAERKARQQSVDTLAEYERVRAQCPGDQ